MIKIWRRGRDSNPRNACTLNGFRDRPVRPLRHLSKKVDLSVDGGWAYVRAPGRLPTEWSRGCYHDRPMPVKGWLIFSHCRVLRTDLNLLRSLNACRYRHVTERLFGEPNACCGKDNGQSQDAAIECWAAQPLSPPSVKIPCGQSEWRVPFNIVDKTFDLRFDTRKFIDNSCR